MDLIFSDIHADLDGLQSILDVALSSEFEQRYGSVSRVINLGDLLERGDAPGQVLEKMRDLAQSYRIISVMGNHDEGFLYKRQISGSSYSSLKAHESLSERDLEFFKQNRDGTYGQQFAIDAKNKLFCVHGGPIDPDRIEKNGEDPWLYQRTWQRLSEQETEFFTHFGYHYKPSSAFEEGRKHFDGFVILCGHQHTEAVIGQKGKEITNLWRFGYQTERMSSFTLRKQEFSLEDDQNYIVRVGLGGPQGHHTGSPANPHFAILQDDPRKAVLFEIEKR